ncbi:uncharacterized protein SAPINGB_P000242 [Magnusiomyces paraingens]|uniref:Major facilitator superfamily (MFS) profile domain-containing protein n=1 Tax=Magnusiomyces paraingens TaxID=2606893 RepID=A0A5E8B511_9ASCO|nr:uncharacterized protein SAPINGB_P000242 [Saprochaete ingens]VVT43980.1 unnamed protein product [Saprochaete ingens]
MPFSQNNIKQDYTITQAEVSGASSIISGSPIKNQIDLEKQLSGEWCEDVRDRIFNYHISSIETPQQQSQNHPSKHQKISFHLPTKEKSGEQSLFENTRNAQQSILQHSPLSSSTSRVVDWLQVLGGFLAMVNSWGWYGVFKTFYNLELLNDRPLFHIAWIGSIHTFLVMTGGIMMSNRMVAAGYTKLVMSLGAVITALGMMMVSLSSKYYQIVLSQGVVMGIGCAFSTSAAIPTINAYFSAKPQLSASSSCSSFTTNDNPNPVKDWYRRYRKAIAVALASTGGALGGIIYPAMALRVVPHISFPTAAKVIGAIIFGTLVVATLLLRPLPSAPRPVYTLLGNSETGEPSVFVKIKSALSENVFDFSALTDINFVLLSLGAMAFNAGLYVPIFFISQFGIAYGASLNYAFYLLPVLNSGSVLGRALPPFLSQKLGPFNSLLASMAACIVIGFAWLAVCDSGGVALFAVMFGLTSGAFMALPNACFAAVSPSAAIAAKRTNVGAFMSSVGILVGPPLGGLLLRDGDSDFFRSQIYTGTLMAAGGVLVLAARLSFTRGQIFVKV